MTIPGPLLRRKACLQGAPRAILAPLAQQPVAINLIMTQTQYADAYIRGFELTQRFLVSRGISYDTAEESAQAAWARGWEYRHQLRDPTRLLTWVNRIALNLFRNSLRRREVGETAVETPVLPQASPLTIDVRRALAKCVPADRDMIEKTYLAGYTSVELGQQNGCTAGAVRIRILRARRRILATLE